MTGLCLLQGFALLLTPSDDYDKHVGIIKNIPAKFCSAPMHLKLSSHATPADLTTTHASCNPCLEAWKKIRSGHAVTYARAPGSAVQCSAAQRSTRDIPPSPRTHLPYFPSSLTTAEHCLPPGLYAVTGLNRHAVRHTKSTLINTIFSIKLAARRRPTGPAIVLQGFGSPGRAHTYISIMIHASHEAKKANNEVTCFSITDGETPS